MHDRKVTEHVEQESCLIYVEGQKDQAIFLLLTLYHNLFVTDRRSDLEEEKKHEDQIDADPGHSFRDRYMDVKDRETSTAGNFAELLRFVFVVIALGEK